MQFHDAAPNELMFRKIDTTRNIEVGVGLVIYGFRVRAGFVGQSAYCIDWCAGPQQKHVEALYFSLLHILGDRKPGILAFEHLPMSSDIKPFFNDFNFCANIASFLPMDFQPAKLPDLAAERLVHQQRLNQMFN